MVVVAGIDVSKATLDVSVSEGDVCRFNNTGKGISSLLNPNPPRGACERPPEEAKGCTSESEIMVLQHKTCHRKGAPNRCYHVTTLTASKSPSTIPAW